MQELGTISGRDRDRAGQFTDSIILGYVIDIWPINRLLCFLRRGRPR